MPKRILQGTVVSDKNDKTVVVKVERRFTHPVMKKTVRRTKKYKAHDEDNALQGRRHGVHRGSRSRSPRTSAGSSSPSSRRSNESWKAGQGGGLAP